jgi:hypothetical protein
MDVVDTCNKNIDCQSKVDGQLVDTKSCFRYTDDQNLDAWVAVILKPVNKGSRFITFRMPKSGSEWPLDVEVTSPRFNVFDDMTFSDAPDAGHQTGFNCKWTSGSNFHRFDDQAKVANDATSVFNVTNKGGDLKKYVAEAKKIQREGGN